MTRTKENAGKDMRSQINKLLTLAKELSNLKRSPAKFYWRRKRSRRTGEDQQFRALLSKKTLPEGHDIRILCFAFLLYKYARFCSKLYLKLVRNTQQPWSLEWNFNHSQFEFEHKNKDLEPYWAKTHFLGTVEFNSACMPVKMRQILHFAARVENSISLIFLW